MRKLLPGWGVLRRVQGVDLLRKLSLSVLIAVPLLAILWPHVENAADQSLRGVKISRKCVWKVDSGLERIGATLGDLQERLPRVQEKAALEEEIAAITAARDVIRSVDMTLARQRDVLEGVSKLPWSMVMGFLGALALALAQAVVRMRCPDDTALNGAGEALEVDRSESSGRLSELLQCDKGARTERIRNWDYAGVKELIDDLEGDKKTNAAELQEVLGTLDTVLAERTAPQWEGAKERLKCIPRTRLRYQSDRARPLARCVATVLYVIAAYATVSIVARHVVRVFAHSGWSSLRDVLPPLP